MPRDRDVLITGIGLVSCLGDGLHAHRAALADFRPVTDETSLAPFVVHPLAPMEFDRQIPKRDQRQMELWQRIGTYAAGQALESAGVKGNTAVLERMDMTVAAGGGERDVTLDEEILSNLRELDQTALNERLMSGLRPTLFLAQLPNLLAGCISIVHGVVGSSRTFMGEEQAGADAVRIACARIAAGQGDIALVGGALNAQRPDLLLHSAMNRSLMRVPWQPVWARQSAKTTAGVALGSVGCFLVLESRSHALDRGVRPIAAIAAIGVDRCTRLPGQAAGNASRQLEAMRGLLDPTHAAIISAASGASQATLEERAFLDGIGLPVRAAATALGHSLEPSFPAAIALAAMAVSDGALFPPLEPAERPMRGPVRHTLVSAWGNWRGEALALVAPP